MNTFKPSASKIWASIVNEAFQLETSLFNFLLSIRDTRIVLHQPIGINNYNAQMQGFGLYTHSNIPKGIPIMQIPLDMCLDSTVYVNT